jgi:hypothetical protein
LKRLIQIRENKLKKNNPILAYSLSECSILEKSLNFFLSSNIIIFIIFLLHNSEVLNFTQNIFAYNYSLNQLIFIFIAYLIFIIRIINTYKKGFIKKDIYKFILRDKFSYFVIFAIVIAMLI